LAGALTGFKGGAYGSTPTLSATVAFAEHIVTAVMAQLDVGSFRSIVLPYEGQPFQHAVFRAATRWDPIIKTVGYLHSALPPLPTDLIHRAEAPAILLVHGRGQADILTRHLGWPRSALRVIQSLRYRDTDAGALAGSVFLPYSFDDVHVIETAFRDFIIGSAPGELPLFVVRNHPVMQDSVRHRRLQRKLQSMMRKYADRFTDVPAVRAISVFIGATAAIVEALERGVAVIHVCSRPLTEAHSAEIWADLAVERLGEHLFRYELSTRGAYIDFGNATNLFERTMNHQLDSNLR
jgi:hypothetical protein